MKRLNIVVAALVGLLVPATAHAVYYAKVNAIRVNQEGHPEVLSTILDLYGEPVPRSAIDSIHVFFGEPNELTGGDLEVTTFKDSGEGTDYVIILPAYEGFGISNAVAAAEGASAFFNRFVGENDTFMAYVYGDGVMPFEGDPIELATTFREPDGVARVARPYMLSALDEAVNYYYDLEPGRRRVIILVGTGMDVRLSDAASVQLPEGATEADWESAFREVLEEHEAILERYVAALDEVNARVYAIGYNDARPDYLEVLKVISRKSEGTYRRVTNIGDLSATGGSNGVFDWVGAELESEYILRPDFSVESGKEYEVWVTYRFPVEEMQQVSNDVTTRPFYLNVEPFQTRMNIIPYLILVGVILVVAFLLLVLLFFMTRNMRAKRQDLAERKKLQEKIDEGEIYCPTCYRKMQPDWQNCLFCASGMPPLEEKPQAMLDADEARQKLAEMDGKTEPEVAVVAGTAAAVSLYATHEGKTVCKTCGRVVDPTWKECMFCAAGMPPLPEAAQQAPPSGEVARPVAFGPDGQPPPLAKQAAAAPAGGGGGGSSNEPAKTVALTPKMDACPQCGRPVPSDWTECLYCKAGV